MQNGGMCSQKVGSDINSGWSKDKDIELETDSVESGKDYVSQRKNPH